MGFGIIKDEGKKFIFLHAHPKLDFRTLKIIFWNVPGDIPSHDLHNFPNVRVSIHQTDDGNRCATLSEGAVGTFLWWNWSIVG